MYSLPPFKRTGCSADTPRPKQAFTSYQVLPAVAPERRQFPIKAQAPNGTGPVQDATLNALEPSWTVGCASTRASRHSQQFHGRLYPLRLVGSHTCLPMRLATLLRDNFEAFAPIISRSKTVMSHPSRDRPLARLDVEVVAPAPDLGCCINQLLCHQLGPKPTSGFLRWLVNTLAYWLVADICQREIGGVRC